MARINLLPWREELRRERQKQFMMSLMASAIVGVVVVFMLECFLTRRSSTSNSEMI